MRILAVSMLLLALTGCDWLYEDFKVITADDLKRIKCESQAPEASKWYYIGSEEGYHKLVHRDASGDNIYQIEASELAIDNPKHTSWNEANWVLMPWGPKNKECQE